MGNLRATAPLPPASPTQPYSGIFLLPVEYSKQLTGPCLLFWKPHKIFLRCRKLWAGCRSIYIYFLLDNVSLKNFFCIIKYIQHKIYSFNPLSVHVRGIKYIHLARQPSPPSPSRTFSSSEIEVVPLKESLNGPCLIQPLAVSILCSVSVNLTAL